MSGNYATLSNGRMYYEDQGAGPPILFVHGTPTNSFEYRHLIAALSATHRCIAPDHLGFGKSDRPANFCYTPEAHAAALREFVDTLGLTRFTLVVHDFGGPIGLPLALSEDTSRSAGAIPGRRGERVVIMNSWAWPLNDDPKIARSAALVAGGLGRFLYRYANASLRLIMPSAYGDKRKLTKQIHREYLEVFRDREARVLVLHALAKALLDSHAHYQSLLDRIGALRQRPVLIVWGMKDSAFQPHQLARWQALLPDARVARIDGAGHWPHEEEPARVIEEIQRFLK